MSRKNTTRTTVDADTFRDFSANIPDMVIPGKMFIYKKTPRNSVKLEIGVFL